MAEFKLVSDMVPKGDQPQAIEKLVKGIREGRRHQTLLGVTGSGKSLAPDEPIWIYEEAANGQLRPLLVSIGPLIDEIVREVGSQVVTVDETDLVDAQLIPKRFFALSLNPKTHAVETKPISSFLRHRAPATLHHIKTTCGREVTVTSDHNFWVLRNGELLLLRTSEIKDTDYLPIPTALFPVDAELKSIDSTKVLAAETLFVKARSLISKAIKQGERQTVVQVLNRHYKFPRQKLRKLELGDEGGGIPLAALSGIAQACSLTIKPEDIEQVVIGSQFHDYAIPGMLPVSDELLRLLGYYIADGHGEPTSRYFTITASESSVITADLPRVLSQLGLVYHRERLDFNIASKIHAVLLASLCGVNARSKRFPPFWPELSQRQLAELLGAYFEGDGGVTAGNGVVAVSASRQLVSDILYALLRFGIWARVYRTWQRATNSDHRGDYYWYVAVSGHENLYAFQKHLRFLSKRKQEALNREVENTGDAKKDLIPGVGEAIRRLRRNVGFSQEALAAACGLSRTTLSVVEAGLAMPRRSTAQKVLNGFRSLTKSDQEALQKLEGMMRCRWTRVREVKEIPCDHSYVYDLSVADNETLFGGFGGLFLHNTFAMANVIERLQKPTLIMSHNKTLAAQLYAELKSFFPENAVEYFVSYYDYYQPEAYIPQTDTYIEKDSSINDRLDQLRLSATTSLMSREDVIIVASVSCIYNLGSPEDYRELLLFFEVGQEIPREELLRRLVGLLYERNDVDFSRGRFRVRGETMEVFPAYEETAVRLEMFGDRVERISLVDPVTGNVLQRLTRFALYPAKHFITTAERIEKGLVLIEQELVERLKELREKGKLLEAQRLESRTQYDMEMMREVGFCHGIENYSRALSGRPPGSRPGCLLDYFPKDFLTIIDESHVSLPQLRGMYEGDRTRKQVLVEFGFRLPSCLDNRPLKFEEFEKIVGQQIFVSATPGPHELKISGGQVIEQVIRPTGLVDPQMQVRPIEGQVDDILDETAKRASRGERTLVTTLTKRMAEDLASYLKEAGLKVTYIHSDLDAFERVEVLKNLRLGHFDCVVGINLLREGLDLPEVSLVCVLDADKEGFLRSSTSLIQVSGRAARHLNGQVILYADCVTDSMRQAMMETQRRRKRQLEYNKEHGITPRSVEKAIREGIEVVAKEEAEETVREVVGFDPDQYDLEQVVAEMEQEMEMHARNLQFERAAGLRDQIADLRKKGVAMLATLEPKADRPHRGKRWKRRY